MDRKSATYVDKYERFTRASGGFILRREHALDLIGANPGRVLEGGCGPGIVTPALSARGIDTHGVDLSAGQLETAVTRDAQTLYVQANLEVLPYKSAVFDTVILLGVLEYVERPKKVMAELARTLTAGGRLILSVPSAWSIPRLWTHYAYLPSVRLVKRVIGRPAPTYGRKLYSLASLGALLESAGLRVDQTRFFDLVLAPPPFDWLLDDDAPRVAGYMERRSRGRLRQILSMQIIVRAVVMKE